MLPVKTVRRKDELWLYLKEGDRIAAFLALLGASSATLSFEDARAEKELRNYINRTSNCETANIGKTVYAAGEQLDAITGDIAPPRLRKALSRASGNGGVETQQPRSRLQELADFAGIRQIRNEPRLQRLLRIASNCAERAQRATKNKERRDDTQGADYSESRRVARASRCAVRTACQRLFLANAHREGQQKSQREIHYGRAVLGVGQGDTIHLFVNGRMRTLQ
jgi:hypothetical protein